MCSEMQATGERFDEQLAEQVVDPEDYNRTQRFKEIHQARQRVSEFVTTMEMPDKGGNKYYLSESSRLAYLVSLYVLELEPLIIQSDFKDGELIPDGSSYDSLRDFAAKMGIDHSDDETTAPPPPKIMQVFAAANRFYAHVGMDLKLEEDEGDAGFDYSDILETGPPGDRDPPNIENAASAEVTATDE